MRVKLVCADSGTPVDLTVRELDRLFESLKNVNEYFELVPNKIKRRMRFLDKHYGSRRKGHSYDRRVLVVKKIVEDVVHCEERLYRQADGTFVLEHKRKTLISTKDLLSHNFSYLRAGTFG